MSEDTIVATALAKLDPAELEAFLDDACKNNPELRGSRRLPPPGHS